MLQVNARVEGLGYRSDTGKMYQMVGPCLPGTHQNSTLASKVLSNFASKGPVLREQSAAAIRYGLYYIFDGHHSAHNMSIPGIGMHICPCCGCLRSSSPLPASACHSRPRQQQLMQLIRLRYTPCNRRARASSDGLYVCRYIMHQRLQAEHQRTILQASQHAIHCVYTCCQDRSVLILADICARQRPIQGARIAL